MINVIVIDKTDQIMTALSNVNADIESSDNEIKVLNTIEEKDEPVILLHNKVMEENTLEYIRLLVKVNAKSKIVVVGNELNDEEILSHLLAGASGYQGLSKLNHYAEKLVTAMDAGEVWITRRMTATLLGALRQQ
ncbi:MAG: DNA-binding response regulator [Cycloclasticus sp.]|nr:DNA-binding response regulator [Cycloclasticus sp.]